MNTAEGVRNDIPDLFAARRAALAGKTGPSTAARRKQTPSHVNPLRSIYALVVLAGLTMQGLLVYAYYNGERVHRLSSPLLTAVREIRLEAGAALHEIDDVLNGRSGHGQANPWLFLDQAVWYLHNLARSGRATPFDRPDPDESAAPGDPIQSTLRKLATLKAFYARQTPPVDAQEIAQLQLAYQRYFNAFLEELDRIESGVLQLTARERLLFRYTHIGLLVLCFALILLVGFTLHRYERQRRSGYDALNRTNQILQRSKGKYRNLCHRLQASNEFLQIANLHTDLRQLLEQFMAALQQKTGCGSCAVRLLDPEGGDLRLARGETAHWACGLDALEPSQSEKCLCARIVFDSGAGDRRPATGHGSFFLPPVSAEMDPACEAAGCMLSRCRSVGLVPIRMGEQVLGLIQIADHRPDLLTRTKMEVIEAAAMQIGAAVVRLRAESALKSSHSQLEQRVQERTLELSRMNVELQREVEERRRTEQRLAASRNTLQTVIDGINDALILVDNDLRIRALNRTAAEILAISSCQGAGRMCHEVVCTTPSGACEGCKLPQAVSGSLAFTFERAMKDGEGIEQVSIYPVTQKESDPGGAIVRITDITEQKHLEGQLIRSEKMASLGILVSSIAHEINNPNSFVTFNIPILRDYLEELIRIADVYSQGHGELELFHMSYPEFRRDVFKLVDNIEHGASRISSFVANLREYSQNNGDRQKVRIDIASVIEKVLSICRSQIKKRIATFNVHVSPTVKPVYADEYSLEQVLLNLIVNAVQAADKPDACLTLTAASGASWDAHTVITVADNGCGMDAKTLRRIFDPFFTTKPASEGTGLGLYVCHNLIRRLGGRIEVESRPHVGTTFSVLLPDKERRKQIRR